MSLKVIFHIDEEEKWKLLLANARNLRRDSTDTVIEILANSVAVKELTQSNRAHEQDLSLLAEARVTFCACGHSLKGLGIESGTLFNFVKVVPVGVKELIEKQMAGYAYIKP